MMIRKAHTLLIHIAATVLISIGLVKSAERFDPLHQLASEIQPSESPSDYTGNLPCGSNKD